MRAIIIDDEEQCRKVLEHELSTHAPEFEIVAICKGGQEGIEAINECKPDVVFLDIEMPKIDGFEVLSKVNGANFDVIFTTSHDEYAIRAIRSSAFDYLLKPIQSAELVATTSKLLNKRSNTFSDKLDFLQYQLKNLSDGKMSKLALSTSDGIVFLNLDEIIYCESDSAYTYFHLTKERKYLISKNLSQYEDILPSSTFFRCHKSFIINKEHISKLVKSEGGYVEMSNGKVVSIARSRRKEFYNIMNIGV